MWRQAREGLLLGVGNVSGFFPGKAASSRLPALCRRRRRRRQPRWQTGREAGRALSPRTSQASLPGAGVVCVSGAHGAPAEVSQLPLLPLGLAGFLGQSASASLLSDCRLLTHGA